MALNANSYMKRQQGRAEAGGVLRDAGGVWLGGFMKNICRCSVEEAELWAIWHGLILA